MNKREKQKQKAWVAGFIAGLNAQELPPIISTDLQDCANKGFQAGAQARSLDDSGISNLIFEINKYHDELGRWSSKKNAKTASITKKAAEKHGLKPERGKVSATGKVYALYGANTGDEKKQAGRTNFQTSEPKPKTRSLKDYPKEYDDLDEVVIDGADDAYIRAVIKQELDALAREQKLSSGSKSDGSPNGSPKRPRRRSQRPKKTETLKPGGVR